MKFIDTHCHFDFPPFAETGFESLQLARAAGVGAIIVPSTEAAHFRRVLALAKRGSMLFPALGLHPVWITRHQPSALTELESRLREHQEIVAIGEIGLDMFAPTAAAHLKAQQQLLDHQLALARQYQLPVILHSRRSHDKLALQLRQAQLSTPGVIHGFAGSYQQAKRFVDLGYSIGVGGTISWLRANKTRQAIKQLPLESLLLETDAPDMPLMGYQGQPNRPERVVLVWNALCELRDESPQQIQEVLLRNTLQAFPRLVLPCIR